MKKVFVYIFSFCIMVSVLFLTGTVAAQSISLPGQPQGRLAGHRSAMQQKIFRKNLPDGASAAFNSLAATVILDPAFGTNGSVRTFINSGKSNNMDDRATSAALQSDGKIVVAGRSEDNSYYYAFAIARFNRDGSVDSAFGNHGSKRNFIDPGDIDDEANSIVVQSDGKIIAAGYSTDAAGHIAFALARYDTAGNLDTTFGNHGTIKNTIKGGNSKSDYAYATALQSNGKIIAAGRSGDASNNYAFALARYNTDGSVDSTFGSSGTARNYINGGSNNGDCANSIAIQSDGKIVTAGYSSTNTGLAFALARFTTDGNLDSAFGTYGTTVNNIYAGGHSEDAINAVAIQSDKKIIAAGQSIDSSGYYRGCALARYTTDGNLDNTFGTDGTMRNYFNGGNSSNDIACSVVLQSDEKIVTAGWSEDAVGYAFAIARYTTSGSLDSSFNTTGTIRNHISGGSNYYDGANSAFIQPDGKIVAAGWDEDIMLGDAFAVARYVVLPAAPRIVFPANGSSNQHADTLVFTWNSNAMATKYLFQLSGNSAFSSYAVNDSIVGDTTKKVTGLAGQTKYFWRVSAHNAAGYGPFSAIDSFTTGTSTGVDNKPNRIPSTFALFQNYPNPFNPTTNIEFSIPTKSFSSLKIFDVTGREVATLVSEELSAGSYMRQWNAANVSSGIYFYRLQAGSFVQTRKLVVLK